MQPSTHPRVYEILGLHGRHDVAGDDLQVWEPALDLADHLDLVLGVSLARVQHDHVHLFINYGNLDVN